MLNYYILEIFLDSPVDLQDYWAGCVPIVGPARARRSRRCGPWIMLRQSHMSPTTLSLDVQIYVLRWSDVLIYIVTMMTMMTMVIMMIIISYHIISYHIISYHINIYYMAIYYEKPLKPLYNTFNTINTYVWSFSGWFSSQREQSTRPGEMS
jgi:hypothetical protein